MIAPLANDVPVWTPAGYRFEFTTSADEHIAEFGVSTFNLDRGEGTGVTRVPARHGDNVSYRLHRDIFLTPGANYRWRVIAYAADGTAVARSDDTLFTVPTFLLETMTPEPEAEVVFNELGTYAFYAQVNSYARDPSVYIGEPVSELRVSTFDLAADTGTGYTSKFTFRDMFGELFDHTEIRTRFNRSLALEIGKRYRWRLFAHDRAGNEVARSQDAFFRVVDLDGSVLQLIPPRNVLRERGSVTFLTELVGTTERSFFATPAQSPLDANCRLTYNCGFWIELFENYLDCVYTRADGSAAERPGFRFSIRTRAHGLSGTLSAVAGADLIGKHGDSFWLELRVRTSGHAQQVAAIWALMPALDEIISEHYAEPGSVVASNRASTCGTLSQPELTRRYTNPRTFERDEQPPASTSALPTQILTTDLYHWYSRPQRP
ncbi:MAG: hypothetical protein AAF460_12900 [Pseudomonadota bacterium]